MADTFPSDNFVMQPDNDFEKIVSAPASGEGDAPPSPAVPASIPPADELISDLISPAPTTQSQQDGEVSTTTETAGENVTEASEADQYDLIGASDEEAEGFSNDKEEVEEPESDSILYHQSQSSEPRPRQPVILLDDDIQPSYQSDNLKQPFDFEDQAIPDSSSPVNFIQPSAPAPPEPEESDTDNFERLIDFESSSPDVSPNLITPTKPQSLVSDFPELIPTDINTVSDNDNAPQKDGFDSETNTITSSDDVVSDTAVAEQSTGIEEAVPSSKVHDISRPTSASNIKLHVVEERNGKILEHSALSIWLSQMGSWLKGVDPRVIDLIYWRDVKKTGVVFGTMLTVLLCLAIFSLVSVLAYLSLALLTVSLSFVVYKKIMQAVQKSGDGHPFRQLLDLDISLKDDKLKPVIQSVLDNVNITADELRRLFLIEDIIDSVKFGLMLWVSTYIGSWLNGITIVILAVIMIFTLPKVYETYQVQIDNYIDLAKGHIDNVMNMVQSKVPFLKKKEKAQ